MRAVVLLLLTAAPASAAVDVPRAFELFDAYCRPAMQGIEALREVAKVPGPNGEQVFAQTEDGSWITYHTGEGDFLVTGGYRYGAQSEMRDCMVQQVGGIAGQEPVEPVEAEFLDLAPGGEGIAISGGKVLEEMPAVGHFAMIPKGHRNDRREYVIEGAMEPPEAVMIGSMGPGVFRLNAFAVIPR
ncbi:hypothetical protein FHY55_05810 [Oceanicola sp. D3]|uniref:hypothetical protein n=1 Tax=Oceanicola sp. D3 TaxID=2587163 RepID=UPI0011211035|nr:hypothetical protein [Oceanicola sp. D3]QDC08780.1 hypothetical protein FHY55_05810 [Oceanicola sp. D3]